MAGIASVVVSPEYRGRGVGSMLMRGVLARSVEQGFPAHRALPGDDRDLPAPGLRVRRRSLPVLLPCGGSAVARRQGRGHPAGRSRTTPGGSWSWWPRRMPPAGSAGRWCGPSPRWPSGSRTRTTSATSPTTASSYTTGMTPTCASTRSSPARRRRPCALWATVGSGSSIATNVQAYIAPNDPVHLLVNHEADKNAQLQRWMLRVLDAPAAIAARWFRARRGCGGRPATRGLGGRRKYGPLASIGRGRFRRTDALHRRRRLPPTRLRRPSRPVRRYAAGFAASSRAGVGWFHRRGRGDRHGFRGRASYMLDFF